jgi:excisionase family DNA binding protein
MKDVNHDNLIEAKDVAEILNVKLTTVYTWSLEGYLPAFKLGKLVRFKRDEVLAWIEDNKIAVENKEE